MTGTQAIPAAPQRWVRPVAWLYALAACGLAPWIAYLFRTQRRFAAIHDLDRVGVGLLVLMQIALVRTAWLRWRRSPRAAVAASMAGAMTLITAWFRLVTATATVSRRSPVAALVAVAAFELILCAVVAGQQVRHPIPHARHRSWLLPIGLLVGAMALVPALLASLAAPQHVVVVHRLRLAWTGLDVFELIGLVATALGLARRSRATAVPAAATAGMLVCDAWINIAPTHGAARIEALVLACVELPLAALSLWVAIRTSSPTFPRR